MARLFFRLKLRLLGGSLRGDLPRRVGFILGAIGGAAVALVGALGLAGLHSRPRLAVDACIVVYTGLALGWVILPILIFGTDETLDPARLAMLPLTRRQLMTGLVSASVVGIPPVVTVVLLCGSVAASALGPSSLAVAVLAAVLELFLCIALMRAVTTALSGLLRSRRGRDLAVFVGVLIVAGAQGMNIAAQRLSRSGAGGPADEALRPLARVLRWLPPGTAAAAVGDAADGRPALAALELAAVGAALCLLLWWWSRTLADAMVSADASTGMGAGRSRSEARTRRSLLPAGRTGAVAGKELRYAWREPRRKTSWVTTILFGGVFPFVSLAQGGGGRVNSSAVYAVCFVAFFIGLQSVNSLGLDGSALWLQVVATSSAADVRADLAGKNLATLLIGGPALVAVGVLLGALTGAWTDAAAATGLSFGVYGAALAAGNVTSVLAPYPLQERSTSPFSGPGAGRGCLAGLSTLAAMVAAVLLSLPLAALTVVARLEVPAATVGLLVLGPAYGALLAWGGRRIAAASAYPRLAELFAAVSGARAA